MGSRLEQRAREARFWELLGQGMGCSAACDDVGVHPRQGYRWFKAARGKNPFEQLERGSDRFLSQEERLRIADLHLAGVGVRRIAAELGRAPSTVSRELSRNSSKAGHYRPYAAEKRAQVRARRPKPRKLDSVELAIRVEVRLVRNWSPEQIRDDLARVFPDRPEMHVSHEAIYQSLFVQGRGHLRADLHKHLRTGRALRRHRGEGRKGSWSRIQDMVMISDRPAEVEDRAVPGHWEGNLIVGTNAKSAIGTLVERTTRYVMLLHLPDGHSADQVRDATIPAIQSLPTHLRKSLTWDQGTELARHKDITLATDLAIYFCDPHKPWQRGSNENTNGLLRQYFPKSTDLTIHTPTRLLEVATELNERPRKTLDYRTPAEAFQQLLSNRKTDCNLRSSSDPRAVSMRVAVMTIDVAQRQTTDSDGGAQEYR